MTNTSTFTPRTVRAILGACVWAVGLRREVKQYGLNDDECEAVGLPLGSVEDCAYAIPLVGAPSWRLDAWDDGECFNLRVLGRSLEVHHEARQGARSGSEGSGLRCCSLRDAA